MKKLYVFVIMAMVFSAAGYAQPIPNFNFENWTNGPNSAPDGWIGRGSNHQGFYPATRSTDHYLGSYSVQIQNYITLTDTTKGVIQTPALNGDSQSVGPAFAISGSHTSLNGYYKFTAVNGDSALIVAFLNKNGYNNPLGYGSITTAGLKTLPAAAVFTPFSIPIPAGAVTPDSASIEIAAFKAIDLGTFANLPPLGNSILNVDALSWDTYLTGIDNVGDITADFRMYPNSTRANLFMNFTTTEDGYTTIRVYDMSAHPALDLVAANIKAGEQHFTFDVSSLANGDYLIVIASDKGYHSEKLVVAK